MYIVTFLVLSLSCSKKEIDQQVNEVSVSYEKEEVTLDLEEDYLKDVEKVVFKFSNSTKEITDKKSLDIIRSVTLKAVLPRPTKHPLIGEIYFSNGDIAKIGISEKFFSLSSSKNDYYMDPQLLELFKERIKGNRKPETRE